MMPVNPDEIPLVAGVVISLLLCVQWRRQVVSERKAHRHENGSK